MQAILQFTNYINDLQLYTSQVLLDSRRCISMLGSLAGQYVDV